MNKDKESEYIKTGDELQKGIDENDYTPTLSDYEVRLMKDHQHIINRINEIKKAIRTLDDFGVKVDDESMNIHFEHIMSEKDRIEKSILEFMKIIGDKQNKCKHEFRTIDYDSHYEYKICDKCGLQERW